MSHPGKRQRPQGSTLSHAGKVLVDAAVNSAAAAASAAAESWTRTATDTTRKSVPVHHLPQGNSASYFKVVRSKQIPQKYAGRAIDRYYVDHKFKIESASGVQGTDDCFSILTPGYLHPAIAAAAGGSIPAANTSGALAEFFFNKVTGKIMLSNMTNARAHVTLTLVRAREVAGQTAWSSATADAHQNMDDLVGSDNTSEWTRVNINLEDLEEFNKRYEILRRADFSLEEGEEHTHRFSIVFNKAITPNNLHSNNLLDTNFSPLPGYSYHWVLRTHGQVATDKAGETGAITDVSITKSVVCGVVFCTYTSVWLEAAEAAQWKFKTTALNTLSKPVFVDDDAVREVVQAGA